MSGSTQSSGTAEEVGSRVHEYCTLLPVGNLQAPPNTCLESLHLFALAILLEKKTTP